ncbi:hypothetical protein Pan153_47030 [Gimesia panareensis]|uniref:Uncharacterized protein n=1 Tax=Gimesia panareensis TaxID=2527978 RepID=A0A518FUL3_9PLAN|nr:hypothetical protein [Gimesia panareensis]QDV20034.1 hypothetical protein Pan153_47030 [Gimesia panareensis]
MKNTPLSLSSFEIVAQLEVEKLFFEMREYSEHSMAQSIISFFSATFTKGVEDGLWTSPYSMAKKLSADKNFFYRVINKGDEHFIISAGYSRLCKQLEICGSHLSEHEPSQRLKAIIFAYLIANKSMQIREFKDVTLGAGLFVETLFILRKLSRRPTFIANFNDSTNWDQTWKRVATLEPPFTSFSPKLLDIARCLSLDIWCACDFARQYPIPNSSLSDQLSASIAQDVRVAIEDHQRENLIDFDHTSLLVQLNNIKALFDISRSTNERRLPLELEGSWISKTMDQLEINNELLFSTNSLEDLVETSKKLMRDIRSFLVSEWSLIWEQTFSQSNTVS